MFLVRQPEELGKGRDANKRLVQHPGVLPYLPSPQESCHRVVVVVLVVLQGEIGKILLLTLDVAKVCHMKRHETGHFLSRF